MMVAVHNTDAFARAMDDIRVAFPREYPAALATVGTWARGQIKKDMQSARDVAALSPITLVYDKKTNAGKRPRGIGRKLQTAIRYSKTGDSVSVGFLDSADRAAGTMMAEDSQSLSTERRAQRHRLGIEDMTYSRPRRNFIANFVNRRETQSEILRVMIGRINSIVEKAAARVRGGRSR